MKQHKGFYSLIQYCPDPTRAESANVGVLLYCPETKYLRAKTSSSNGRVQKFFGKRGFDPNRLAANKKALETRLKLDHDRYTYLTDLKQVVHSRARDLVITDPREVTLTDPDKELRRLFHELVAEDSTTTREKRGPILPELDEAFRGPSFQGKIQFNKRVEVPALGRTLRFPYSFDNGSTNLVRPHKFSVTPGRASKEASVMVVDGELLREKGRGSEDGYEMVVVSATEETPAGKEAEQLVHGLFEKYGIRFVPRPEIRDFIDVVRVQAHE